MPKTITLTTDIGTAKKGTVFVQGLHGKPDYYKNDQTTEDFWWWQKGSKKDENRFLPRTAIEEVTPPPSGSGK